MISEFEIDDDDHHHPKIMSAPELLRPVVQASGASNGSNRRMRIVAVALCAVAAACVVATASQGGNGASTGWRVALYGLGASEEGSGAQVGDWSKLLHNRVEFRPSPHPSAACSTSGRRLVQGLGSSSTSSIGDHCFVSPPCLVSRRKAAGRRGSGEICSRYTLWTVWSLFLTRCHSDPCLRQQAVETAAHIYPDQVNARNPAVAPDIAKEVAKAEAEQASETEAEAAFASVSPFPLITTKTPPTYASLGVVVYSPALACQSGTEQHDSARQRMRSCTAPPLPTTGSLTPFVPPTRAPLTCRARQSPTRTVPCAELLTSLPALPPSAALPMTRLPPRPWRRSPSSWRAAGREGRDGGVYSFRGGPGGACIFQWVDLDGGGRSIIIIIIVIHLHHHEGGRSRENKKWETRHGGRHFPGINPELVRCAGQSLEG